MVSTLYSVGTLAAALSLRFVGRQIDKRGPRAMVVPITILFCLACAYMSIVSSAVMLGIGFILLRTLGQGSLTMVSSNVVNQWWVRRRGTILGMSGVVTSLMGGGLFPTVAHGLIGSFGWRTSYLFLAVILLTIMLPVGMIFYRRQPEMYGLLPDGARQVREGELGEPAHVEENWTRQEAIRTPAFWIIAFGLAAIGMLATGIQFHVVSIFEDSGLSSSAAVAAYVPVAAAQAAATLASGVLVDRIQARYLLSGSLLGMAASLMMAPRLMGIASAYTYGVVLGATLGLQNTVLQAIWPNYFGRKHMGSIVGVASLIMITGSALGPMPMGIARDLLGSYSLALTLSAGLPLTLGIVALFMRRPQRRSEVV